MFIIQYTLSLTINIQIILNLFSLMFFFHFEIIDKMFNIYERFLIHSNCNAHMVINN